jgi:hypothetical protein
MIIIVWRGWGILALFIAAGCFLTVELAVRALCQEYQYFQNHGWPKALASWIAAAVLWPVGRLMNQDEGGHDLFFIPVQYWAVIFAVIGVVLLFHGGF